jgi:hypothetical protein
MEMNKINLFENLNSNIYRKIIRYGLIIITSVTIAIYNYFFNFAVPQVKYKVNKKRKFYFIKFPNSKGELKLEKKPKN